MYETLSRKARYKFIFKFHGSYKEKPSYYGKFTIIDVALQTNKNTLSNSKI